jgi:hypothetical protein
VVKNSRYSPTVIRPCTANLTKTWGFGDLFVIHRTSVSVVTLGGWVEPYRGVGNANGLLMLA